MLFEETRSTALYLVADFKLVHSQKVLLPENAKLCPHQTDQSLLSTCKEAA